MKKNLFFTVALILVCLLVLPAFCACKSGSGGVNSEISSEREESIFSEKPELFCWLSLSQHADRTEYEKSPVEYTLSELDTVTMRFNGNTVACLFEDGETYELPIQELINAFFSDLNGDGIRELCCTAITTENMNDAFDTLAYRGWAYDLVNKRFYSTVPSPEQGFGWVLRTYENEIYAIPWSFVQYVYAAPCKIVLDEENQVLICESVSLPHEAVESFCYWPANPYNLLRFNTKENGVETSYYVLLEASEVKALESILASYEYEKEWDPEDDPLFCDILVYDAVLNTENCRVRLLLDDGIFVSELEEDIYSYRTENDSAAVDYIKSFMEDSLPYYQ